MERYVVIKEVGYGTFGNVWRAVNKESGEIVAIKKMKKKYYCWEECINLREVKALRKMNHPNIVKLKEVVREYDMLHFIFEYMECNLYEFIKDRDEPFSESKIRNWCFQVFQALAYMHQQGYFHRDLKPENLLVSEDVIKVADFGLAREISSMPPFTEYVSTRCFCILKHLMEFYIARAPPEPPWFYAHSGALVKHLVSLYRAPEVLLQSSVYGPAVDIWAMGAIMAELFNLRPLFPGTNEADEIHKICSVIGSPCQNSWAEGLHLADKIKFQFPQYQGINLSILIPSASEYAISLISSLCSWDPLRRPTAAKALQHPFFKPCYYIPPSLRLRDTGISKTPPSVVMRGVPEHLSARRCSVGALTNKPPTNVPSPTAMTTLKTGVTQRKLDMHQYKDYVPYENNSVQPLYRRPAKSNNPGYLGGVSYGAWDLNEKLVHPIISSGRVDDMAEKLANLTMNSGSQSVRPPPPALKAGSWHSNTRYFNRSYEIPPPARGYPRKAVG